MCIFIGNITNDKRLLDGEIKKLINGHKTDLLYRHKVSQENSKNIGLIVSVNDKKFYKNIYDKTIYSSADLSNYFNLHKNIMLDIDDTLNNSKNIYIHSIEDRNLTFIVPYLCERIGITYNNVLKFINLQVNKDIYDILLKGGTSYSHNKNMYNILKNHIL